MSLLLEWVHSVYFIDVRKFFNGVVSGFICWWKFVMLIVLSYGDEDWLGGNLIVKALSVLFWLLNIHGWNLYAFFYGRPLVLIG